MAPPRDSSRRRQQRAEKKGAQGGAISMTTGAMLKQGLDLFQKASRQKSRDLYQRAAESLRKAAELATNAEEVWSAQHALGECLLEWSESAAGGDQEAFEITKEAGSCFDACLEHKVTAEAANNAGNCYAGLAELAFRIHNAIELSQQHSLTAESRYRLALQHNAEDVEIMSNLAREIGTRGTRTGDLSNFQTTHEMYGQIVQRMDQTQGDDLAGLLQDWGCMLQSMAQSFEEGGRSTVAANAKTMSAESIRKEAIEKLFHAIEFSSTAIAPRLALGDTRSQHSQFLYNHARYEEALVECDKALQAYRDVLSIDGNCEDAQTGHADVQMLRGRCLYSAGKVEEAALEWKRAAEIMINCAGSSVPTRSAEEARDLRYNAACCLSLAAEPEPAMELLEKYVKPLTADEKSDPDLANVRQYYGTVNPIR